MPYNPETEATVVISKEHHGMLKTIATKARRTLRAAVETLIEDASRKKK